MSVTRRQVLHGIAGLAGLPILLAACGQGTPSPASTTPATTGGGGSTPANRTIAVLLAGSSTDKGFMQAGFSGAQRAERDLGARLVVKEGVKPTDADLEAALRDLARSSGAGLIIAHGGQNAAAVRKVAPEFTSVMFAITQSDVTGPNVGGFEVLQEESAWLAGAAAGLLTTTNVVGHMSGIRPIPGLKGRAAYAAGVAHANPTAKLLTNFSGDQDDVALAKRIATAEINEGADIIFTMLNAGRPGVGEAMKELGKGRQIGNVRDWTQEDPSVFVASAVADSGQASYLAAKSFIEGRFEPGKHTTIGLEDEQAVRLTLAPDVPADVRRKIEDYKRQIVEKKITVTTEYSGPEFNPG